MFFLFFFTFVLATLAVALPSPLHKRSFKAPVRGRSSQGPLDDILRVHQKYQWAYAVGAAPMITTTSRLAPAPFPTSIVPSTTSAIIGTLTTVSVPSTPAPAPAPPPYPNSTSTDGNEDGEVLATPEANEIEYLSPVTIGGQSFNLNFDTGSSDLWMFSSLLPASLIGNHSAYNPSLSPTYTELENATWSISYGDGSGASGTVGFDTVDVGGTTVDRQCIELATRISTAFTRDPASDGLLGLGFSSINRVRPDPQKTFFENVMNDLSEPLFTANLMDDSGAGTYEFGVIDESKYKGDIHYVDVDNSQGFWEFSVSGIRIGANDTLTCNGKCKSAIADTGTSLLYLDSDVVSTYYAKVAGSQMWDLSTYIYPCDSTLPDLSLDFGGHYVTIKGEKMTYLAFTGAANDGPAGQCMGGLQAGPSGLQIVGDVFLKQVFAVFDGGNMRFGVAEQE